MTCRKSKSIMLEFDDNEEFVLMMMMHADCCF
jgi:hypothetical protein